MTGVGQLSPGTEGRVVNEKGEDVGPHVVGELWLRGPIYFKYGFRYDGLNFLADSSMTEAITTTPRLRERRTRIMAGSRQGTL